MPKKTATKAAPEPVQEELFDPRKFDGHLGDYIHQMHATGQEVDEGGEPVIIDNWTPEKVIEGANKRKFKDIIVIGLADNGRFYMSAAVTKHADFLWYLEKAKFSFLHEVM